MERTLLLDADIIAYKFSAANEGAWDFGDGMVCRSADLDKAVDAARENIAELRERLSASDVIVCLSDPAKNFRKDIYPKYKSNRKDVRKPEHLVTVKDFLAENYTTYLRPGLEADDCMGILATHPTLIKGEKIMVSEDKDMKTVPGLLFNPRTDKKPREITKLMADRAHLTQTVVGDTSDGYPGARGVGPKSPFVAAIAKSKTAADMWQYVLLAFTRAAQMKTGHMRTIFEDALTQARLARILRASDWDFRAKRPVLWSPRINSL